MMRGPVKENVSWVHPQSRMHTDTWWVFVVVVVVCNAGDETQGLIHAGKHSSTELGPESRERPPFAKGFQKE